MDGFCGLRRAAISVSLTTVQGKHFFGRGVELLLMLRASENAWHTSTPPYHA